VKDLALVVLGWILMLAGIVGLLLPILPGIPFLLTGLIILGQHHAWAQRIAALLRAKARRFGHGHDGRWRAVVLCLARRLDLRKRALS